MTTISVVVVAVIVIRPFWYFVTVVLLCSSLSPPSKAPRFDPRLRDSDPTHKRNQRPSSGLFVGRAAFCRREWQVDLVPSLVRSLRLQSPLAECISRTRTRQADGRGRTGGILRPWNTFDALPPPDMDTLVALRPCTSLPACVSRCDE